MTKTIIAIGGGSFGQLKTYPDGRQVQKPMETLKIDKKIIELTGKTQPKLVFIGAAHGDDLSRFLAIKKYFGETLGCVVENLNLIDDSQRPNKEDLKKIILGADIIYIGGGNVTYLMKILGKTGVDKLLRTAYDNGIIMSGNSAGGCAWFEFYGNDEDDDFDGTFETFKPKRALGFVRGYFEPHWDTKNETGIDKESVSKKSVNDMLKRESISGYGVDEGAAIMIQTDNDKQTITEITSKPGARVYRLNQDKQNIHVKMNQTER
ncbi:MAG: Type 1 glutamine amidotransferase-like domain-containing protein [Alphaproteobacteria bacterium]|nr:Type 1 glutamine amidotransferase-like domain-containing protein [Alphaproteobacteria bacterium]